MRLLSTFNVSNTDNDGPGSLRQAILSANDTILSGGLDTVAFQIPGGGVHTIHPLTALPTISDAVVVDGYTQPGTSANTNGPELGTNAVLLVELNLDVADGLLIDADGCVVRGLVINRMHDAAIVVDSFRDSIGGPKGGAGTVIEGNFIGTTPAGDAAAGPIAGGGIIDQANDVLIGGTTPAARNLISGVGEGVGIGAGDSQGAVQMNVRVQGNLIGTDATGTVGINQSTTTFSGTLGVYIFGAGGNQLVGGNTPSARNIISGFDSGVQISDSFLGVVGNNRIQGNYIGLDVTGTAAIPNRIGVLSGGQLNNMIGGTGVGEGNVISGNRAANVVLGSVGDVLQGNLIGPNATNAGAPTGLPGVPAADIGVEVGRSSNTVGGIAPGSGNVIAYNLGQGVFVDDINTLNVPILGNSIFSNARLGIDLLGKDGHGGVNSNNSGPFNVANEGQNYPEIASAAGNVITATLHSVASMSYRVELFASAAADPTGFGEGQTFLGFVNVTTGTDGNTGPFTFTSPVSIAGKFLTATATLLDTNSLPYETSEFSAVYTVPASPVPVANADSYTVAEGDTLATSDVTGTATPGDSSDDGVLANDTDSGGNTLTAHLVAGPLHASNFTLNPDGSFTYTHDGSETTSDSFTYQANDGPVSSNTVSVAISITPQNDPPRRLPAQRKPTLLKTCSIATRSPPPTPTQATRERSPQTHYPPG